MWCDTRDYNDDFFQCLEKFSSLTHQVSCNLDVFMRVIHDTEFPNSVEATQKLLDEQGNEYERLKVRKYVDLFDFIVIVDFSVNN